MKLVCFVINCFGSYPQYDSASEYLLIFVTALVVLVPLLVVKINKAKQNHTHLISDVTPMLGGREVLGQLSEMPNSNREKVHVAAEFSWGQRIIAVILISLFLIVPFADLLIR